MKAHVRVTICKREDCLEVVMAEDSVCSLLMTKGPEAGVLSWKPHIHVLLSA